MSVSTPPSPIVKIPTDIQKIAQMAHERMVPLITELSSKVIQIKCPHEGSTKVIVF